MFCGNCGNELREGAKFCGQCGWRLDDSPQPVPQDGTKTQPSPTGPAAPGNNYQSQWAAAPGANAPQQGLPYQYAASAQGMYSAMPAAKGKGRKKLLIGIGIVVVVAALAVLFAVFWASRYERMVKTGYFDAYPDQTIGEAFSVFFKDPSWDTFSGTDGNPYVKFNGGCYFFGRPVEAEIIFRIYGDAERFEISRATLDGTRLSDSDIQDLLYVVYSG